MIQRIQSVYLLLAGLLPAFTFWVPLMRFLDEKSGNFQTLYGLAVQTYGTAPAAGADGRPWGLIVMGILCVIMPIFTIFGYKNRKVQMRKTKLALLLIVLYYAALAFHTYAYASATGLTPAFAAGSLLPLLSFVCLWLALRAIRKDEALVRAADRIR